MANYNTNNPVTTLINGIEYSWSSVNFVISGTLIEGITDISYSQNLQITPLYGRGNKVNSYSVGNHEYTGSITIRKSELDKLTVGSQNALKESILHLEPFPINIVYKSLDDARIVTEQLLNVMFTTIDTSSSQNDEAVTVNLNFLFTDFNSIIL